MKTSFRTKRLIVRFYQRGYIDIVAWFVFLSLNIGFSILYFWYHYDRQGLAQGYGSLQSYITRQVNGNMSAALLIILRESLIYTFWMMVPVYVNLNFLKPLLLDNVRWNKLLRYFLYISGAIVVALAASAVASFLLPAFISRMRLDFPINALVILGVMFISTGIVFTREVSHLAKRYQRLKRYKTSAITQELEGQLHSSLSVFTDHIKVGKKNHYKIIPFSEILYFQGDGNEPIIVTANGRHFGTNNLSDYEELLPKQKFLRVHRSFIIAKDKVLGRKGNDFLIKDDENNLSKIPIGKTYTEAVDKDGYLGF
jgi:hypothetical protein